MMFLDVFGLFCYLSSLLMYYYRSSFACINVSHNHIPFSNSTTFSVSFNSFNTLQFVFRSFQFTLFTLIQHHVSNLSRKFRFDVLLSKLQNRILPHFKHTLLTDAFYPYTQVMFFLQVNAVFVCTILDFIFVTRLSSKVINTRNNIGDKGLSPFLIFGRH